MGFLVKHLIKYLRDNAKDNTYSELAKDLDRTQCALERKMRNLNIKPKLKFMIRKWTDEDTQYLIKNAKNKTYHELSHDLDRSYSVVVYKMNKLNIAPKQRDTSKWTKDEIKYIYKNAKDNTYPELAKELNRSKLSVERKMVRLNIKPKRMNHFEWPEDKVEYLIKNAKEKTYFELASDLDKHPTSIRKKMHKLNIKPKMHPKYKMVNHDFFKTWSDDMAYILGYWFADGCIHSNGKKKYNSNFNFSISSKDLKILKKIKDIMKSTYVITKSEKKRNDKIFITYRFNVCSKEIYNDIIKLGGCERKSLTAKFPDVPDKYVRHFIRGYFDGDGSVRCDYKYRNYPLITFLGTYDFLSELISYLNLSIKRKPRKKRNIYEISYSGQNAQDILQFMYKDSSLYLKRKYDRYKDAMKWKRTNNHWTKDEIRILKNQYYKKSWDIYELLKNHTKESVRAKASQLKL